MARLDPREIYTGWEEIALALGKPVRAVRRLAAREGLPVFRTGAERGRGMVWTSGRAILAWVERRACANLERKLSRRQTAPR